MRVIYLDNAATTRVSDGAAAAAVRAMTEVWGNPSSLHRMGTQAGEIMRDARRCVADAVGLRREEEIILTSGGTEANNLAVLGAARGRKSYGRRVIISSVEHPSVYEAAAQLETEGFEVVRIRPRSDGVVHAEDFEAALTEDTVLLSCMYVNNETGAIMPVPKIAALLKRHKSQALLHCDAVQAFGRLPVRMDSLGVDMLTVSGHKIHAPKGVGALCVRRDSLKWLKPLTCGGGQQEKRRPGTEAVPSIAAFAQAIRELPKGSGRLDALSKLNAFARERLSAIPGVTINSPADAAPHIISAATGCIKSETLLNFLSGEGICVSSGSACSKGVKSRVLTELALPDAVADSTIRISFCDETTEQDIIALCEATERALATLARFK